MRELIKARIVGIFNDSIGLELPDGKELYMPAFDKLRAPAMIDTVRPVLLELIVGEVEKLDAPAYGIFPRGDKDDRNYTIIGQVLDIGEQGYITFTRAQAITLDTGNGTMAVTAVGKAVGAAGIGDYIKINSDDGLLLRKIY